MPESEVRRRRAVALYETETTIREEGWPSEEFVYDAEHDLYRFADGGVRLLQGVRQRAEAAGDGLRRVAGTYG